MKKIFLSLIFGIIGFICFCDASSITITYSNGKYNPGSVLFSKSVSTADFVFTDFVCPGSCGFQIVNAYDSNQYCTFVSLGGGSFVNNTCRSNSYKFSSDSFVFDVQDDHFQTITITGIDLSSSCPECETCPEINTGDILSGSCDTNYCVENDLCPVPSNFSQLFINDIEFPSKPLINVFIPDYIYWDYSSSDSGYDINVGSGYDQDYIDSVLKINSYRPDSSDFTDTFVSGLTLIFPYIFVALLIVFIWKLLKRIFK